MKNGQNVFVSFLEALKIKHTQEFSDRYVNEHPHKYNLFGISKMLSDYGVENVGTRIADKVYFLLNGHEVIIPALQFIQSWSGFILLAETTPNS